jgi:hypothetical protein
MICCDRVSTYAVGQGSLAFPSLLFTANRLLMLRLFFLLCPIVLPLNIAFASEFELSRIASELNLASEALAKEKIYSQGFSGLSHRASSLARESSQLIDAIHRNRNPSNIRSQFNDVSRRYTDLEDAFWRGYRNSSDKTIFQQLEGISKIYSDLFTAYTLTRYYQGAPQIHIFVGPNASENGLPIPQAFFNTLIRP